MRVLFTNNLNEKLQSSLENSGVQFDIKPLIETHVQFEEAALLEKIRDFNPQLIAVTSKNTIPAFTLAKDLLCDFFSVATISKKIAGQIEEMGIQPIISDEVNSESLAKKIREIHNDKRVLHLCGNLRSAELTENLKSEGIEAEYFVVYQTEQLKPEIKPEDYDIVIFTSYSAIDSFYSRYQLNRNQGAITVGPKTSDYLRRFFDGDIITSNNQDMKSLVEEIQHINEHD